MGRGRNPTETLARTFVTLRGAKVDDPAALRAAVESATAELEQALAEREHFSKAEAASLLEVSAPTLDKWVAMGLLPVVRVPEYKRERVPARALLALAGEVKELRRLGRKRGLLAEAVSRLEQEDPAFRERFDELYGPALRRTEDAEYVSAAPGPDWDPDD
jgi:DNA-binding transcriptional MerR regulator